MSWDEISIGEIGEVITGNTPPKKKAELYGDAYKFIKASDMVVGQRYTPTTEEGYSLLGYKKYKNSLIPANSTCVVTIGTLGRKMTFTTEECFVNQAINAIVPSSDFDPLFVFYAVQNIQNKVKAADTGASSGRENVSKGNFKKLKLFIPRDKRIQKKIAKTLGSLDDLIENNLRRIKLLEEAAQHIYKEWFVHFRFPNHEQVELDKETGLPKGWEKKVFSELVFINPRTKPSKEESPYVPMGSLSTNSMVIDEIEKRVPKGGSKFKNGDTLFARITPCLENGKTGFVHFMGNDDSVATGSTEFMVFRENKSLSKYFIYCTSRLYEFRENAIKSMTGSDGRQRVKKEAFDKYFVSVPSTDLMNKYNQIVSPKFKLIQQLVTHNKTLKEARDILLPRLMNQTITVS